MSKKFFALILLMFVLTIVGCSDSNEGNNSSSNETELTYNEEQFNFSLVDTTGKEVNVTPDGKTMYVYFTGVG